MILSLDVGNTHIHGGVFEGETLRLQFRRATHPIGSSDEIGLFLRSVIRENGFDPEAIRQTAVCSVVPQVVYPLRSAIVKYFNAEPFYLQPGVRTGLKIKYRNPLEVGADRIANAIAVANLRPEQNVIVVDCGTATTVDIVTAKRDYLGGVIMPGPTIWVEALAGKTARLPTVEIMRPEAALGRSTVESIQSGVYLGQVGAIRHLTASLIAEVFPEERPLILGTGGFARMLEQEDLFDEIIPDLVLRGIRIAALLNIQDQKLAAEESVAAPA